MCRREEFAFDEVEKASAEQALLPQRGSKVPMLAARTNHDREGRFISFWRAHFASLSRRVRRWRGEVDGRRVVEVHVLMQFSWAISLVTPHFCMTSVGDCYIVDVGGEKGCRDVKRLTGPKEDAGHGVDHVEVGRCVEEAYA